VSKKAPQKPGSSAASQSSAAAIVPFQFKPGEVNGPKDVVVRRSRAAALLMSILTLQDAAGNYVNAQRWFDAVLKSEYLMGKVLDKMMPTLTPEQINLIAGSFEQKILQLGGNDAPLAQAPSVAEPTTERGPFDGHVEKIIEAITPQDPGSIPATPAVVKPQPRKQGA